MHDTRSKRVLVAAIIVIGLTMATDGYKAQTESQDRDATPKASADCEQYRVGEPRSGCVQQHAIKTGDVALCLTIPKESFIFASRCECLAGVAKKIGDVTICDRSDDSGCRTFCQLEFEGKGSEFDPFGIKKANKLDEHAIKTRDVRVCDKQSDCVERSECIANLARNLRNEKLCARILGCRNPLSSEEYDEQDCRSSVVEKRIDDVVVTGNIPRCDRLKGTFGLKDQFVAGVRLQAPLQARDFCRIKMASNYARSDVCETIRDRHSKEHCLMLAAVSQHADKPKPNLCKRIRDKAIREECITRLKLFQ